MKTPIPAHDKAAMFIAIIAILFAGCKKDDLTTRLPAPIETFSENFLDPYAVRVSRYAGSGVQGYLNCDLTHAHFNHPESLIADSLGNIYVCEPNNYAIRKISNLGPKSTVSLFKRTGLTKGLAIGADGNFYGISEGGYKVYKISPSGEETLLAGSGYGHLDGPVSRALFGFMSAIAVGSDGAIYVADADRIRKISTSGRVSTIAGGDKYGHKDGPALEAQFNGITAMAVASDNTIYIVDRFNQRVRQLRKCVVSTLAGGEEGFQDGKGPEAKFNLLTGITLDSAENIYVTDGHAVRMISKGGLVHTIAGNQESGYANGNGSGARFNIPFGVAYYRNALYVSDYINNVIRKVELP